MSVGDDRVAGAHSPFRSTTPRLILASTSPRRRALLPTLGLPFEVESADVPEQALPGESAEEMVRRLATSKARAVAARLGVAVNEATGPVVLAADTTVVDGEQILGKPTDVAEATAMLRRLSGRAHRVITGVCVVEPGGKTLVDSETTGVHIRALSQDEIERYVATGDPMDKAGAYALQNAEFQLVESIEGCQTNVVGLPLCRTAQLLADLGFAVPATWQHGGPTCPCHQLTLDDFRG